MKKSLFLCFAVLMGILVGCQEQNQPTPPNTDGPGTVDGEPTFELVVDTATVNSVTFSITAQNANKFAYMIREASSEALPSAEELFNETWGAIEGKITISESNLVQNTKYQVIAVVANDQKNSAVVAEEFTTAKESDAPDYKMIELLEANYTSFKFKIKGGENYFKFLPVEKAMLDEMGYTPMDWVELVGGFVDQGDKEYEWVDGLMYQNKPMDVAPGREYVIIAGISDAQGVYVDGVDTLMFRTPSIPSSDAEVSVNFSDITSTSVNAYVSIDETISSYYVYVRDREWYDNIIAQYGEDMIKNLIKNPNAGALTYAESTSVTWNGLIPNTEYTFGVLGVDNTGSEVLVMEYFTTDEPSGPSPELVLNATPHPDAPNSIIELSMEVSNAIMARWAVMMTCEVEALYRNGSTNESIIDNYGKTLSDEELSQALNGELVIKLENLFRSTEYTIICAARSVEYLQTTTAITATTGDYPSVPRVESSLFEDLLGTWNVEYEYTTTWGENHSMSGFQVNILAGADDASAQEYRSLNRLVVTEMQFKSYMLQEPYPYYGPQDLIDIGFDEDMAYRDYGPKFFLEIGEGDVVTCPTDASNNFAYFTNDRLYFLGCDHNKGYIAPVEFPVEVSADKNTITIKQCVLTSEQYPAGGGVIPAGTYRPAILENTLDNPTVILTTDIVLTRAE